MVTIKGLTSAFKVAKNPHSILWAKVRNKKMNVTFSSGQRFNQLTWPQFRFLRDNYELVMKYKVEQVSDEIYLIHVGTSRILGSPEIINIIDEIDSGSYNYDCRSKVVLDIGGYKGESAVFFWEMGASKVIIYEPVVEHKYFIQENIRLNNINAEVHFEGIASEDGEVSIAYEGADNCFGLDNKIFSKKKVIKVKDTAAVLANSGAEVVKIDCEGAEISLVKVPNEILRKSEYFMIEIHSNETRQQLIKKFTDSGFIITRGNDNHEEKYSLMHFKRI